MSGQIHNEIRFSIIAHDLDGIFTLRIVGAYCYLRRKADEILSDLTLMNGLSPRDQLTIIGSADD